MIKELTIRSVLFITRLVVTNLVFGLMFIDYEAHSVTRLDSFLCSIIVFGVFQYYGKSTAYANIIELLSFNYIS